VTTPYSNDMQASSFYVNSDNDSWLVGMKRSNDGSTAPLVEHWDGTEWTRVDAPSGVSPPARP
jgi:hypothetical protein